VEVLEAYIPIDRRHAMAAGQDMPDRMRGAALFADVSGFTPLTEALLRELGPRRGADELTRQLNRVFDALIVQVHHYGGCVITFCGDAITCWFDGDSGLRATACGLAMQEAMEEFAVIKTPRGGTVSLAMKAAMAAGPVRRFRVGDPGIQYVDVLAGATLDRMITGEHLAERGEVVISPEIAADIADHATVVEWRKDDETGDLYAVTDRLSDQAPIEMAPLAHLPSTLPEDQVRPWLLPPVYKQLKAGQGRFLGDIRPAVALFLRFRGLDYDDDDAVGEKLDVYIRWVQGVLARYEGYMLQLITGDKGSYLYASFGAPFAHEDDTCRAVSAAIDLRSLPPAMDFIESVQIGISQGRMRTGDYGGRARRTYGVLSDEVNIAARLMTAAQPGEILVTSHVANAVQDTSQLECLGAITVKGKQQPLTISRVIAAQQSAPPRSIDLFAHPLVGRDKELAQMEQMLENVLVSEGQILRLEGEAGLGKSHLVAEFTRRAIHYGVRGAAGVCQSTGQTVPYYPWRQIFRTLLGLDDEPGPGVDQLSWAAQQIAQVEALVSKTNPDWFPRLPLLGDLLGLPIPDTPTTAAFDPQVRQQALFVLAVEMVQAWAQEQPLLLLLEDMRWIDEASQELTLALGQSIAQSPVLLALVHRPPIRADEPLLPDLNQLPYHHHLDLSELSPEGVTALVTNRLQGQPSALTMSLVQTQAQGNPFYTEELVDTLRESEALYRRADDKWYISERMVGALRNAHCLERTATGEWTLVPNAPLATADLGIPDSIHGVVLTRIDRLPEDYKLSLKVASVIGRVFEFDLLAQSHPVRLPQDMLRTQVKEMETRDFTRLELPPPQLVYMFKHNITHEVVYGTLLRDQERELHREIGNALERLLPEAIERLAYHYYEGQVWPQALTYNLQIARQAQRGFANDIAVEAYGRVLEAASQVDADTTHEQELAHEALGEVLTLTGRYEEALNHYASARTLVPPDQAPHMADLCHRTAEVYERRSEYDLAFEWLDRGLDYLGKQDTTIQAARIHRLRAGVHYRQGKYEESIASCQKSLAVASGIETREGQQVVAQANYTLGNVYHRRGDLQRAAGFYRQSIAVYKQLDDIVGQATVYNNLGSAYKTQGDWGAAGEVYQQGLDINREIGDIQRQGFFTNNLGNIHLDRGEWDEAAIFFEESISIWQRLGAALFAAVTLSNLGQVHIYQENWAEARDCLSRSQVIFAETGSEVFLPELERRWGALCLGTQALDEALDHLYRSIELAMMQEARVEEGISLRIVGEVFRARGEDRLARAALLQSRDILNALNSEYEVAKTHLALAAFLCNSDPVQGRAHLEGATQTFRRLGARADLEEALSLDGQMAQ
jgi:class 3 adenylate cyclase/tetratricopeptide (TPR) repeat protein